MRVLCSGLIVLFMCGCHGGPDRTDWDARFARGLTLQEAVDDFNTSYAQYAREHFDHPPMPLTVDEVVAALRTLNTRERRGMTKQGAQIIHRILATETLPQGGQFELTVRDSSHPSGYDLRVWQIGLETYAPSPPLRIRRVLISSEHRTR